MTQTLNALKIAYNSLQQYVESNYSLFHELSVVNLMSLANDKLKLYVTLQNFLNSLKTFIV
jgi:hypothetical protein